MIYDVLLNNLSVSFVTEVKLGENITRTFLKGEDYQYIVERTNDDACKLTLISVEELMNDDKWVMCSEDVVLENCLLDMAYIINLTGTKSFIYKGRTHSINVILQDSPDYIYSQGYSETLKRSVVYRHPKLGSIFTLAPDEVTYEAVDYDTYRAAVEQADRLKMPVAIPETWLTRMVDGNGAFKYRSLRDVYLEKL